MRSKALLLLFIFLLNTATGFACALMMSDHEQVEATDHHDAGETAGHHHDHNKSASLANQHHADGTYIAAEDDPCCQGLVNSFNSLAKVAPLSNHIDLLSPFIYLTTFFLFFLIRFAVVRKVQSMALFKRRRPPTQPIRISIQSFQI